MARTVKSTDGVASKIAKYVPAEMIALATALFAAFDPGIFAIFAILLTGSLLNAFYLYSLNAATGDRRSTKPRFYLLSAIAFPLWLVATSEEVAAVFQLNTEAKRAFVLSATTFILPLLDSTRLPARLRKETASDPIGEPK